VTLLKVTFKIQILYFVLITVSLKAIALALYF